jgi:serine/threonine protein kinase
MADENVDDRLVANLVTYDEALAQTGDPVEARQHSAAMPGDLAAEVERAQECIEMLALLWPTTGSKAGNGGATPRPGQALTEAPRPLGERTSLGRFQLLEVLGQGGMGTVYRALHTRLDRVVALKVLNPLWVKDPDSLTRFRREIRAVGKLQHPHLVPALDADECDGVQYLVMEFVEGMDLQTIVHRRGALAVADACQAVRQAASALSYIHQQGFVHRDVKPGNLMLGLDGSVRLLDMGLALLKEPSEADALTRKGHVVGTVDFMAPEQMLDAHSAQDSSDIYSLGCTPFHLLVGHPPFSGQALDTPGKKVLAHVMLPAPSVSKLRPDIPVELAGLIHNMMAKDPARRPISATVVVDVLEPFCREANLPALIRRASDLPTDESEAKPAAAPEEGSRPPSEARSTASHHRPTRPMMAGLLLVLLVATVVFVLAMIASHGGWWRRPMPPIPPSERQPGNQSPSPPAKPETPKPVISWILRGHETNECGAEGPHVLAQHATA